MMNELLSVLKNSPDSAYDFICNNYYKMSKEELKDFAKELLFVIHVKNDKVEHDKYLKYVANELEMFYDFD